MKGDKPIKLTSPSLAHSKNLPNVSTNLEQTFTPLKSTREEKASPEGINSSIEFNTLASLAILCLRFPRTSCHDAHSSTDACSSGEITSSRKVVGSGR
ncbi:hypothetical protein ACFXTN_006719 [Malus domestica]